MRGGIVLSRCCFAGLNASDSIIAHFRQNATSSPAPDPSLDPYVRTRGKATGESLFRVKTGRASSLLFAG
jgi:hypothetical protein